jgi:hypothetical protein
MGSLCILLPASCDAGKKKLTNFMVHPILCEPSIFEKAFIWFLAQPVVWSEPNISQIEAWSLSFYAWYQEY